MARIRTIKPTFWSDAAIAGLSRDARLLVVGLISFADDEGRFVASTAALAGFVFPHDNLPHNKIKRWLDEVASTGMVNVYRVSGLEYGEFPKWTSHQKISHPYPSTLPAAPESFRSDSGMVPE